MEYVCRKIEGWIRSKVREAGAKGVVLGMSGGVDSSVVAVLADRALGKKSLALILPCESDKKDRERAKLVAKRSGIKTKEIDLSVVFNSLKKLLPEADRKTLGNLKSRLRMLALYHFANKYSYLVLGTSNKSELKIGYVTKYGDSAVDLEPIGDLYKTQVVELAKHLQIHEEILKSGPTAGLWKG
ncbi:MAG: NAD(+) synthase, partial [Candidatus Aenigmarchaeota archaeon]|nr:NAD(+) synthase [Candidatus Aenigmarchaeota archaeon]